MSDIGIICGLAAVAIAVIAGLRDIHYALLEISRKLDKEKPE